MPTARNSPAAINEALRMFVVLFLVDILTKKEEVRSIADVTLVDLLFRMQAVVHLPQLVGRRTINDPTAHPVRNFAEEQLAPAIAIGIHRVHQFESRRHVEMILVGDSSENLVQVVVDIRIGY